MKNPIFLILLVVCIAGMGVAKNLDTGYEPEGLDELTKQKGTFKTTLVRPDADFSRYTKLNPRKVMLVVRGPGPQSSEKETGSLIGSRSRGGFLPEPEALAELKHIINETIVTELSCISEMELVGDSGPETLVIRASVTDAVFDETSKIRTTDGEPAPVLELGTIVFDLIDGETGVIQARVGERRKCQTPQDSSLEGEDGVWSNATSWTQLAVTDLCLELRRMKGQAPGDHSG